MIVQTVVKTGRLIKVSAILKSIINIDKCLLQIARIFIRSQESGVRSQEEKDKTR
ncbi:MAG: hypothetical protein F6K48_05720 [Okeania sp. SIO3H1]|nr:hypothetical protein [Okeania sp. SIO3H1]